MKHRKLDYKNNLGLILIVLGSAIWLLPFLLVAVDNLIGTTKPADMVIDNFGLLVITIGPILIVAGLAFTLIKVIKHLTRP